MFEKLYETIAYVLLSTLALAAGGWFAWLCFSSLSFLVAAFVFLFGTLLFMVCFGYLITTAVILLSAVIAGIVSLSTALIRKLFRAA